MIKKQVNRKINYLLWVMLPFILASSLFAQETHNLEIIWQKTSPDSVFCFGRCIASGDVNGDSFSDIMIVGDSVLDLTNPDSCYRGVCWMFLGGYNFDTIPDFRLNNLQKLTFFALHSGDINGDGFDDVILGGCNNANFYGEILIFWGGNSMDTICDYKIRGPHGGSGFGGTISSGDVNGDGYNDLIIGAPGTAPMPGGYDMGRVYIYYGGPNFDTIPDIILNGGHENDREEFGFSVSGAGDVNNDRFDDIIIGATTFGSRIEGRIYIYFGGNPMDTIFDVAMMGEGPNQALGWYGVDFLKNDFSYDNALTGCCFWPNGFPRVSPGKVYVLFGGNPMDSIPDVWMIGRTTTSGLGDWTVSAGNLNMSNSEEIVSGAPIEYNDKGSAYLWLGGASLDTIPDAWLRGVQTYDGIGWLVAKAGDVD
ncbi:MAG: integrin alpha, partial [bacterium]